MVKRRISTGAGVTGLRTRSTVWLRALRLPFVVCTIVPVLLGAAVAWGRDMACDGRLLVLSLAGAALLNVGANLVDDYYGHVSGTDAINREYLPSFSGGSRVIQEGLLEPSQVLSGAIVCLGAASLLALPLGRARGVPVFCLGATGLLSALLHASPRLSLSSAGLGELAVGLNFGVLATIGAYYVQAGRFSIEAVAASLPLACVVSAMLLINEFPDATADAATGRRTLVVRLGKRAAALGYAALMVAPYPALALGVLLAGVTPLALLALLTAPWALAAARVAVTHYADPPRLAEANRLTRKVYAALGVLMVAGYLLQAML